MYLILKTYLQCAAYSGKLNWYFLNSAVTWTRRFLIFLIKVLAKNYAYEGTNIITGLFRRLTQASPLPFSTFFLFNLLMHALQVFCIAIVHRRHEEYSVPLCCGKKKEKRVTGYPFLRVLFIEGMLKQVKKGSLGKWEQNTWQSIHLSRKCERWKYLHLEDHAVAELPQWEDSQSHWHDFGPPLLNFCDGHFCGELRCPTGMLRLGSHLGRTLEEVKNSY